MYLAQYREAGVLLLRGFSIQEACHQIFGNNLGSCKGRQMPIVRMDDFINSAC